ncbi:MAG: L-serine ammonia-lyase, iron-sulfur-dependent, subunit alpha [Clostridia bacterium]|nr:L-serine ammonia-lyase, iron-sulfur-dependent, subunit alpha [Clostridia bacterium]
MNYNYFSEIVEKANQRKCKISSIVKEWEEEKQEKDIAEIVKLMSEQWQVMKRAVDSGLNNPQISMGGLIGGEGKKIISYMEKNNNNDIYLKSAARALAVAEVSASMGKIVAAPTAGSAGIIPAVMLACIEKYGSSEEEIIDALFTASGLGIVIAKGASISGAEGGCQAECGSAGAMAAAAAAELMGGSPQASSNAAAMVLKNVLGLVCDPVAGLVEVPCAKRNVMGTTLAIVSAEMAVAGVTSVIPLDEVIAAMDSIGKSLPAILRETGKGGLAVTPTGLEIEKRVKGEKKNV